MNRLIVPAAVAATLIVVLTYWEAVNQDRFSSSAVSAEEFGKRFVNVPKKVGSWEGTDTPVGKETLEQAGAVNHVSRTYVNTDTMQRVNLWLIVGHARDVVRHTPDICNPSQGVAQQGTIIKQQIDPAVEGFAEGTFNTAKFHSEVPGQPWMRYFWAWNGNAEDQDKWEAPDSPRYHYGNNPALYKLYFSAGMKDKDEAPADSVAKEFAELMLPEIDQALFPERYGMATPATESASEESAEPAAADEATDGAEAAE